MAGAGLVDLLVLGRVATLEGVHGFGWVEALAIGEGRVVAAGRRADVEPLAGAGTRRLVLDPARHVALPGLTDAHLHLVDAAVAEEELDLTRAPDAGAVLAAVSEAHRARARSGDQDGWLLGRGWAVDRLGAWPTAEALEAVAPGRPVALWSHDHHARWVSPAALAQAGIDAASADPRGGSLHRDEQGRPTGVLHEHAAKLVDRAIPGRDDEAAARALEAYARRLWAWGIVGCHDPGEASPEPDLHRGPALLGRLAAEGRLPVRVHACVRAEQLDRAAELGLRSGAGVEPDDRSPGMARASARFRVGWLKHFADGTLGSATAALLAPYEGLAGDALPSGPAGGLLLSPEELAADLRRAARAGLVAMVHAIGDRAVRVALDAIEASLPEARETHGGELPLAPRLEHVQLLDPTDRPRFGALGVAASIQPAHLRTDRGPAQRLWGRRAE
ncbi:MAG TPA: amidohydrolase family protein, partial [Candidatus Limnocylindrales bacterium]|nr:amidohydrolase family protein [Candidatus Limnocylindrales bacterium]